jgi:hypothetical protein
MISEDSQTITPSDLAKIAAQIWSTQHLRGDTNYSFNDAVESAFSLWEKSCQLLAKKGVFS